MVHHKLSLKWPRVHALRAYPVLVRAAANYFDLAPLRRLLFLFLLLKQLYLHLLHLNELIGRMQFLLHF